MIFDLIAGMNAGGGAAVWTPADLFKNGEVGFWFDGSDMSTMFQDASGTVPVTATGQAVARWNNKLVGQAQDYKMSNSSASRQPILNVTSGKSSVLFDGVEDLISIDSAVPDISCSNGLGIGVGFSQTSFQLSKYIFDLQAAYFQTSYVANMFLGDILGRVVDPTNSAASPVRAVLSGSSSVTVYCRLNDVLTTAPSNGISTSVTVASKGLLGTPAFGTTVKISQWVLINRVLTPEEAILLETFIGSKQ